MIVSKLVTTQIKRIIGIQFYIIYVYCEEHFSTLNEVTENGVTENGVTENEVTENEVTENEVTRNGVTRNGVTAYARDVR